MSVRKCLASPSPSPHADVGLAAAAAADAETTELRRSFINAPDGQCFFVKVGYWTYELCPWDHVRQYHVENQRGQQRRTFENLLGVYEPSYDVYTHAERLYVQRYVDGTDGRQVTVRYQCLDNSRDEEGIATVKEPVQKNYVITLKLESLCDTLPPSEVVNPSSKAPSLMKIELGDMQLLQPLQTKKRCFVFEKGYWQYEFCAGRYLRQYHKQERQVTTEFRLGGYDPKFDRLVLHPLTGAKQPNAPFLVYEQSYLQGDEGRSVQVNTRCSWRRNEHTILSVDEPNPQQYVIEFSSPLLCEIACVQGYEPAEPSSQASESSI